ncbi:MAG: hypothetical protein EAZ09_18340 [Oscillatoriales cyanobacterium]|nr:MAG: hypothetical protein EAZ18_17035 [Oscillatoriales cyanobacterium]TAH18442.1 MAG: hypothetical protein EAZ09_18340 [Oscillatoriales cyanobacterium]
MWNISNRQDACSTKDEFSCGTGILPVHKRLIENGKISQLHPLQNPLPNFFYVKQNNQSN